MVVACICLKMLLEMLWVAPEYRHSHPLECVCSERFVRRGVVRKFGGSTHCVYIFRIGPIYAGFNFVY